MTSNQRDELVNDIRAMAMQMKVTARHMMQYPGKVAAKGVEMRGAADIALEWADAIARGEE